MLSLQQLQNKSWYRKYFYHQDQEIILAKLLQQTKSQIFAHPEKSLKLDTLIIFLYQLYRRRHNYPLAYLLQEKEFYNLTFKVNKNTLIPRQESELFIEELKKINPQQEIIADLGTGSGALIITTATLWPNNYFYGSDISKKALKVARLNGLQHRVKINWLNGNLLQPYQKNNIKPTIILANLPYLTKDELAEKTIKHEPRLALDGGQYGLELYSTLFNQLNDGGIKPKYIFLEINPEQSTNIVNLINKKMTDYHCQVITDLPGLKRLVKLSL